MEIPPGVCALPLHDGRRVFLRGDFIDAEVDAAEVHAVHREGCGRREPETYEQYIGMDFQRTHLFVNVCKIKIISENILW